MDRDLTKEQIADFYEYQWRGLRVTRWGGTEARYDSFRFQLWMHIIGGHAVEPNDWTQCVLSSDQTKEALEWHRHRLWDTNTLAQTLQTENNAGLDLLAAGQVATTGQGNGDMLALLQDPPSFRWAVAAPPVGPSGKVCDQSSIDNWGIWKGTKAAEVCWEFIKLLALSDEIQLAVAAHCLASFPRRGLWRRAWRGC